DALRQLGRQHLHDDLSAKRRFVREENARHSAATEFPLDDVRFTERRLQLVAKFSHWNFAGLALRRDACSALSKVSTGRLPPSVGSATIGQPGDSSESRITARESTGT